MPILDDTHADHDLLGPILRRGLAQGRVEGEQTVVMRMIEKRFGSVPSWGVGASPVVHVKSRDQKRRRFACSTPAALKISSVRKRGCDFRYPEGVSMRFTMTLLLTVTGMLAQLRGPGGKLPRELYNSDPTHLVCNQCSLEQLVREAFGVRDFQLSGPKFLNEQLVDVKVDIPAGATEEQYPNSSFVICWRLDSGWSLTAR